MKPVELVGHGEKIRQLMRSVQTGRIVHAFLFTGPEGTGKRTAAAWIAQAMLCTGADAPCGQCPSCRQFEKGLHPDVLRVQPEKGKRVIPVSGIRALIDALSLKPYQADRHVVIMEQADLMNASAQNALLKTLETPPGDAVFLLLTSAAGSLLPTIRSRCLEVRFSPLPVEQCAAELERRGIPAERARLLSGAALGAVGEALRLDSDGGFMAVRDRALSSLALLHGKETVLEAVAALPEEKGCENAVLSVLELWARDRMAVQERTAPFQEDQRQALLRSDIDGSRMLQAVLQAKRQLAANVSWVSIMDLLYLTLCESRV